MDVVAHQNTVADTIKVTGKGLHSGRIVRLEIFPAPAGTGIIFKRTDCDRAKVWKAVATNISATELCTTLGNGVCSIATIEHLMAAFAGLGIDNARVELNAPEVPIMDGSSKEFVSLILKAGIQRQSAIRRAFVVKEAFEVRDGDRFIRVEPAKKTSYVCSVDYGQSYIGKQKYSMREFNVRSFLELSYARTFCHIDEVNAMRQAGLAQGGSLQNAVVVSNQGVLNEEGLRCDDEFVRHKLLDCIGDLALLGAPLIGRITVHKPGHGLHADFAKQLLAAKGKYLSVVEPAPFPNFEEERQQQVVAMAAARA